LSGARVGGGGRGLGVISAGLAAWGEVSRVGGGWGGGGVGDRDIKVVLSVVVSGES